MRQELRQQNELEQAERDLKQKMIRFFRDAESKMLLPASQERAKYLIDEMLDATAKGNDRRFDYATAAFDTLLQYPSFDSQQELVSLGREIISHANIYWTLKQRNRPREL